jgi:sigma-B regulation protein RsbU (phosphoserine phosphatase)
MFYLAVFTLFSTIGFLNLMTRTTKLPRTEIVITVLLSGVPAVLYAILAIRRKYLPIPLVVAAQIGGFSWLSRAFQNSPVLAAQTSLLASQLQLLSTGGALSLGAAYTFFMLFSSREGERFFRTHTEIALAQQLHQALVPEIHQNIYGFEIYGASVPSGEVGGDLVDLVTQGSDWTAYVADVSGHGVAPGVLMAMFKASVRSRILAGCEATSLLAGVHQTLYPLKTSNMFVTAGFLQECGGRLTLSLAGHPALLHLQRTTGEICEYASADLPMGILPEQSFSSRNIECQPGDILLLLTDGLTEAANQAGDELGIDPIKAGLRQWADLPLPELFRKIRALALGFGKQQDDQTMLLVRRST